MSKPKNQPVKSAEVHDPSDQARKDPNRILGYVSLDKIGRIPPREARLSKLKTPWVPFFEDSNNSFINQLVGFYERSSTHRTAVNTKVVYTVGDDFIINRNDGQPYEGNERLEEYLLEVNADGESLYELFGRWALDYILTGNFAIETAEEGLRVNIYHRDITQVRLGKPGSKGIRKAYISDFWEEVGNKADPGGKYDITPIDIFSFEEEQQNALLYQKDYRPNRKFYGLPDYYTLGGMKWINIEYKIPSYNLDRIDNKFIPAGLLTLIGEPPDGKTTEEYLREFLDRFTGEGNNSKLVTQLVSSETQEPKYIELNDEPEGIFQQLQDLAVQNLLRAHRTHPALLVETSGKLSNANEVRTIFEIYMNTVIVNYQNALLKPINRLLRYAGFGDYSLSISNVTPVTFLGQIDINSVIEVNEARKELGLDPKPEFDKRTISQKPTL